jgi:hypothetical protein
MNFEFGLTRRAFERTFQVVSCAFFSPGVASFPAGGVSAVPNGIVSHFIHGWYKAVWILAMVN